MDDIQRAWPASSIKCTTSSRQYNPRFSCLPRYLSYLLCLIHQMPPSIPNTRVQIQARVPPHARIINTSPLQRRHANLPVAAERDLHARASKGSIAVGTLVGSTSSCGLLRLVLRDLVEARERHDNSSWDLCWDRARRNSSSLFNILQVSPRDD